MCSRSFQRGLLRRSRRACVRMGRRGWLGRSLGCFTATETQTVKPKQDGALSLPNTRSYRFHREDTLYLCMMQLLKETGRYGLMDSNWTVYIREDSSAFTGLPCESSTRLVIIPVACRVPFKFHACLCLSHASLHLVSMQMGQLLASAGVMNNVWSWQGTQKS